MLGEASRSVSMEPQGHMGQGNKLPYINSRGRWKAQISFEPATTLEKNIKRMELEYFVMQRNLKPRSVKILEEESPD